MSLPRFFARIADAAVPVLNGVGSDALASRLQDSPVSLGLASGADADIYRPTYLLAANLMARLYPAIVLEGPRPLVADASELILSINPACALGTDRVPAASLWLGDGPKPGATTVVADASAWGIALDSPEYVARPASPFALLAASCIGVGEVFRTVFAAELGDRGRTRPEPNMLNLFGLEGEGHDCPLALGVDLGDFALVGAGAIGQAALLALHAAGVSGRIAAIDPQVVELSNLQRYVLCTDGDVGAAKVAIAERLLEASELHVAGYQTPWSAPLLREIRPARTLVALDSAEERIALQAALPGPLYNAWTQPSDLGSSRHEAFGESPCLACLYWPTTPRQNRHEMMAGALGEHPLRTLAYLTFGSPAGFPLAPETIPQLAALPAPPEAPRWMTASLLDDVAARFDIPADRLERWRGASLDMLYREAVCGEAMLDFSLGTAPQDAIVPLAHQSALAGVLLASQLVVAAVRELRDARSSETEGRVDVLASWPQVVMRPRQKTSGCLCSDDDFIRAASGEGRG